MLLLFSLLLSLVALYAYIIMALPAFFCMRASIVNPSKDKLEYKPGGV